MLPVWYDVDSLFQMKFLTDHLAAFRISEQLPSCCEKLAAFVEGLGTFSEEQELDVTDRQPEELVHLFAGCGTVEEAITVFKASAPPKSAASMLDAIALYFERRGDNSELRRVYRRIGDVCVQMSELTEATRWYERATELEGSE